MQKNHTHVPILWKLETTGEKFLKIKSICNRTMQR